jgi:hypothetical protein
MPSGVPCGSVPPGSRGGSDENSPQYTKRPSQRKKSEIVFDGDVKSYFKNRVKSACANNHYARYGSATVELFQKLREKESSSLCLRVGAHDSAS